MKALDAFEDKLTIQMYGDDGVEREVTLEQLLAAETSINLRCPTVPNMVRAQFSPATSSSSAALPYTPSNLPPTEPRQSRGKK